MDTQALHLWVLAGCAVLLVAVVGVRLATRGGLPALLLYLALGVAVGEAGLGVEFEDVALTQNLGLLALALILAEGGLTTRWAVIRPALGFAVVLSTVGVAVSVAVVAAVTHLVLDTGWQTAVLLGAVVSSTDAAAVFSVLRRLPLRGRLVAALEAESGFNDAPVVILVTLVVSDAWAESGPLGVAGELTFQLAVGAVVGLVLGRVGQWLLSRSALPAAGLYPLATLALCLAAYTAATVVGASGFLAVYLAALWLGNVALPHRRATLAFTEGMGWLAQIGLFVLLGLLASPARLPSAVVPALVVGVALTLLARPASVLVAGLPFRLPWREQAFLSWAGLRGAVPIVLTTIPATAGLPGSQDVFDIVFVLVVVFTLLQGPTLPWAARRLGVDDAHGALEMQVESAPLDDLRAELLAVGVTPGSRLHGVYVDELRLPTGAVPSLVVRGGEALTPERDVRLVRGDRLLVVTTQEARPEAERRLRALARAGRLAHWHGERGDP